VPPKRSIGNSKWDDSTDQTDEIIELMIIIDEAASKRDLDRAAIRTQEEAAHPSVNSATASIFSVTATIRK